MILPSEANSFMQIEHLFINYIKLNICKCYENFYIIKNINILIYNNLPMNKSFC